MIRIFKTYSSQKITLFLQSEYENIYTLDLHDTCNPEFVMLESDLHLLYDNLQRYPVINKNEQPQCSLILSPYREKIVLEYSQV